VIHPTAEVSPKARVGARTRIWHHAQVREGAVIGDDCVIGKGVYIDRDVVIGRAVKVQNYVSIYRGVRLGDGVFVGPHATFSNDLYPRAVTPDGDPLTDDDWEPVETVVEDGASIGAGAIIRCGVTIGRWAMVGAGSVVTRDVPPYALVVGHPARQVGYACECGRPMTRTAGGSLWACEACGREREFAPLEAAR
jgi:UDP-2-acetamido-3-amino-2,3-dideoxy-glucuronate N-acetyltransferase